jgi:BMFP domain-containing protein YqiC
VASIGGLLQALVEEIVTDGQTASLATVIVAALTIIPATIAALNSRKTRRELTVNGGKNDPPTVRDMVGRAQNPEVLNAIERLDSKLDLVAERQYDQGAMLVSQVTDLAALKMRIDAMEAADRPGPGDRYRERGREQQQRRRRLW